MYFTVNNFDFFAQLQVDQKSVKSGMRKCHSNTFVFCNE